MSKQDVIPICAGNIKRVRSKQRPTQHVWRIDDDVGAKCTYCGESMPLPDGGKWFICSTKDAFKPPRKKRCISKRKKRK